MTTVTLNTITRKVEVFSSARDVQARAYGHDSKPALEAVNVPPGIDHVFLRGYSSAGDGGAAHYKRVASEPGHPGKIQSNDGAWWEIDETRLNVKMFGTGTAAFQAAIDVLSANGGRVTVPPGDYSTVVPGSLTVGAKVVTWQADRGVTLPANMPGTVMSQGNFSINDWSGDANRNGDVWHHSKGSPITTGNARHRVFHVDGRLSDNPVADDRLLAAYSFHLETDQAAVNGGSIRGLYGTIVGDGGQANIRAVRVLAEGKNGHTGNLTGALATVVHTDSVNDVSAPIGESNAVQGSVGAGCKACFSAGAFNGSQRPSFAYAVSTSASAPLRPQVAAFFAHGGGNGAMFQGRRDIDGAAGGADVTFSVDNKARVMARSFYSGRRTLATDTAIAIAHPNATGDAGFFRFWAVTDAARFGEAFYRTTGGAVMTQIFTGGTDVVFTIGILTGTTGTAGKLTVSAHTDGNIYIENRLTGTKTIAWAFIAPSSETGQVT